MGRSPDSRWSMQSYILTNSRLQTEGSSDSPGLPPEGTFTSVSTVPHCRGRGGGGVALGGKRHHLCNPNMSLMRQYVCFLDRLSRMLILLVYYLHGLAQKCSSFSGCKYENKTFCTFVMLLTETGWSLKHFCYLRQYFTLATGLHSRGPRFDSGSTRALHFFLLFRTLPMKSCVVHFFMCAIQSSETQTLFTPGQQGTGTTSQLGQSMPLPPGDYHLEGGKLTVIPVSVCVCLFVCLFVWLVYYNSPCCNRHGWLGIKNQLSIY